MSKHQLLKSYKPQKSNSTDKKHIVTLLHLNSSTDSLVTNCPSLWTLGQDKHLSFYFEPEHNVSEEENIMGITQNEVLIKISICAATAPLH